METVLGTFLLVTVETVRGAFLLVTVETVGGAFFVSFLSPLFQGFVSEAVRLT